MVIFELGAQRHLPDPESEITRLRGQLEALLTPRQSSEDAARHALDAARLARDQAARLLPMLIN
jgi:multidrug efflux pump subunit AcrA (membrane-fusion protein)